MARQRRGDRVTEEEENLDKLKKATTPEEILKMFQ